jgi:6-phospho-3-hexuloisomerase
MKEINLILKEIKKAVSGASKRETEKLMKEIIKAKKINVIGHGRSWHVAKSFAMRLKHLGLKISEKADLTIVISGHGESKDILSIVKKIKKGKIICITSYEKSHLAKGADLTIELKAKRSKQPLRSLFEQSALIYLDAIIMKLMTKLKINEKEMWKKHK